MKKFYVFFLLVFFSIPCHEIFAQTVDAGSYHSLILCSDGTVKATGANWNGQIGDGTFTDRLIPVSVGGLTSITAVSGGGYHSMALRSDGTVWTWGYNSYGQLGDGTNNQSSVPVQTIGLTGVIAISGGESHSIALKSDGTVWAWGDNGYGQLGDGTFIQRNTPVQVSGLTGVVGIAAGYYHSLAVKSDGTVWSWGANWNGQLGDGTTVDKNVPVQVSTVTGITQVSGGSSHSLARKNDGTVWAWGYNGYGQIGDGTTIDKNVPVQVSTVTGITQVSAGYYHSLATKNDGTAWAWGNNWDAQVDPSYVHQYSPIPVFGMSGILSVSAGDWHSLAVKNDASFWGWGYDGEGELGDGTGGGDEINPVLMKDCCSNLPKIALSDTCLAMDTTVQGGSSQKIFFVKNDNCGSLIVSSITSSNSVFSASPTSFSVPAPDSSQVTITFSPTALGSYSATITIFNNDKDTTICISGYSIPAPSITVTPTSFNHTVACGDSIADTLTIINGGPGNLIYNISILNPTSSNALPIAASCTPTVGAKSNCCLMGIYNVTLNTINNTTLETDGRYNDYTSSQSTILMPGQTYTLSVQTGITYNEYVEAWIDYNNDGVFAGGELAMNNLNTLPNTIHTAIFTVPTSAEKNKSVRMRVSSDHSGTPIPTPCSNVVYGQTEDYTIKLGDYVKKRT